MKTFTLRLTDNEAEALNRMAACYGISKNKILATLIANEYENLMFFEKQPDPAENTMFLYSFEDLVSFPYIMQEHFDDMEKTPISEKKCVKRILSAFDYVLENETDESKIAEVEKSKEWFLDKVATIL